jgi:hypothetical protein
MKGKNTTEQAPTPEAAVKNEQGTAVETGQTGGAAQTETGAASASPPKGAAAELVTVKLRHTTIYPFYRRAGLVPAQKSRSYKVTAAQLAELEKDGWVVIEK